MSCRACCDEPAPCRPHFTRRGDLLAWSSITTAVSVPAGAAMRLIGVLGCYYNWPVCPLDITGQYLMDLGACTAIAASIIALEHLYHLKKDEPPPPLHIQPHPSEQRLQTVPINESRSLLT